MPIDPKTYRYMSERKLLRSYKKLIRLHDMWSKDGYPATAAGYGTEAEKIALALDELYQAREQYRRDFADSI